MGAGERAIIVVISGLVLASCGHKDLKAPCSARDVPRSALSYAQGAAGPGAPGAIRALDAAAAEPAERDCGPLRPLNTDLSQADIASAGVGAP